MRFSWVNLDDKLDTPDLIRKLNRFFRQLEVLFKGLRRDSLTFVFAERIESEGDGLVLPSPDGSRWLISVDNAGNITSTAL